MISIPQNVQLTAQTLQFLAQEQQLFIGGEWTNARSGNTFPTYNPANGEIIATISLADEQDINVAVEAARMAFSKVWYNKVTPAQRANFIWKLAELLERDIQILMELETLDNGKPLAKAKYDVLGAINHFKYYAGWATKIEGASIPIDAQKVVYTRKEPLGVVGLIVPWNFPLMIAAWKLAPALACGNCCILKPAEQTSLTALYLGRLVQEA